MGDTRRRDRLVRLLERVRPARYRAATRPAGPRLRAACGAGEGRHRPATLGQPL